MILYKFASVPILHNRLLSGYRYVIRFGIEFPQYRHGIGIVLLVISCSYSFQLYAIYLYRYMDVIWHISD